MANIIPPLVSDSPPPPPSEDEEDDEFDDFQESNDLSYGCDSFSITSSPEQSPKKVSKVPSSKESEFNFDPERPKTIIMESKVNVQTIDGKPNNTEEKDVNSLEESLDELSISERSSSSKHIEEDCNNLLFKNNFVNKDLDVQFKENIPSQLILESKNFNQETEICDSSDKLDKTNPVVLNDVKSNVLNLSNKSTTNLDRTDTNFSADSDNSQNGENNFDSELSISVDLKSTNIDNLQLLTDNHTIGTSDLSTKSPNNSDEIFDELSLLPIHSKNVSTFLTSNLVKDNIDNSSVNKENIHDIEINPTGEFSLQKEVTINEDFGNFISHPTSEPIFNNSEKECTTTSETKNKIDEDDSIICVQDVTDITTSTVEIERDNTSFIVNSVDTTNEESDISNLPPKNEIPEASDGSDFENFRAFVSVNEVPVKDTEFENKNIPNTIEITKKDEEFANFATFSATAEEKPCTSSEPQEDLTESSSAFGDFAECLPQSVQPNTSIKVDKDEDDFENFATFSANDAETSNREASDDEFGDFGDFTSSTFDSQNQQVMRTSTQKTNYPLLNQEEAFKKAQEVIKEMFEPIEEVLDDFQHFELAKEDYIFNQLQDITDTPALSYHWSKSTSQKLLLKSLNIDSRNILYSGHSWNPAVPRFAANLGLQPLEPVKMEPKTSTPSTPTPSVAQGNLQSQTETQDVPNAEFDWTSSGLVNPLDYKSVPSAAPKISETFKNTSTPVSNYTEESCTKNVYENSEPIKLHDGKSTENEINHEDDDFTEFHSSVPLPLSKTPRAMPVLEPLKPTPVYSNTPSSQINWPDPGITDDDIRKFEQAFTAPIVPKNQENTKKGTHMEVTTNNTKTVSPQLKKSGNTAAPRTEFPMWDTSPVHKLHKKLESKKVEVKSPNPPAADEEEWSDFVSVAKPSPVHKTKLFDRTQTSSPDLTLSVLNLGSIQPAKQPIPVITPQGLVQTKLSTNTNSVSHHKSNLIIRKPLPQSQPSIISNQFASQAYNVGLNTSSAYNFSTNPSQSSIPPNQKSSQVVGNFLVNGQEDDEWGEFVSSPLPPPHLQNSSTTMGHHNWNQFIPNSRSGQFLNQNQFSSGNEMKKSNSVIQKKTSQVPGLVLPEMDFLALKDRTGVSKKK